MTKTEEAAENKTEPVMAGLRQLQQMMMHRAAIHSGGNQVGYIKPWPNPNPIFSSNSKSNLNLTTSHTQKSSNLNMNLYITNIVTLDPNPTATPTFIPGLALASNSHPNHNPNTVNPNNYSDNHQVQP